MFDRVGRILDPGRDLVLLFIRSATGLFLVYGVIDNVVSPARMEEFVRFLEGYGFAPAGFWGPVSVYAQLLCGTGLVLGFATRVAGLGVTVNFIVAIVMVDGQAGVRAAFPALALVMIGLVCVAFGPGRVSLDARFGPGLGRRG